MTLPSFVRETLCQRSSASRVFIGLHETDMCLVGYNLGELAVLRSDCRRRHIAEEGLSPDHNDMRLRRVFGSMEEIWVRDSGRVDIPTALRKRAQIGAATLIIGTGASFELWDPQAALEAGDTNLREYAAFHMQRRNAA